MLKELWRKLGADFLQVDALDSNDANAASDSTSASHGVKLVPHITHTGEFHLARLNALLRARYGKGLAVAETAADSDQALKHVITFAARVQDQDIQRELLLFYLNCSPVIQEYLRAETPLGHGPFFNR